MRFVPVLGNHYCQTLSGVVVCRSLAISTEQIHTRTTTELCSLHCGPSCRLETKAWPSQTIVAQNGRDRPASTESWPGDGKATHAGQSGMAATRGNGNVDLDKLLQEKVILQLCLIHNYMYSSCQASATEFVKLFYLSCVIGQLSLAVRL